MRHKLNKVGVLLSSYPIADLIGHGFAKTIGERIRYARYRAQPGQMQKYVSLSLPDVVLSRCIRVMYVLHRPLSNGGGTERFVENLAKAMTEIGHKAIIVAHCDGLRAEFPERTGNIVYRIVEANGLVMIEYRHIKPPHGLLTEVLEDDSDIAVFCEELIERFHPDIVHLAHLRAGAAVTKACRRRHVPYGVTITDFFCLCRYSTLIDWRGRFCAEVDGCRKCIANRKYAHKRLAITSQIFCEASFLAAPSQYVAARIEREYGLQSFVIAHDVSVPATLPKRQHCDYLRLIYAGKVAPLKGLHLLLPALVKVKRPFALTIYGGGREDYVKRLRNIVGGDKRFTFAGPVSHDQMWQFYAQADVVVIPSLVPETYSFSAHEAVAAGCRIIATDVGALTEVASENGALLRTFSPKEVEEALEHVSRPMSVQKPIGNERHAYCRLYATALGKNLCRTTV